jgi:hypothetical protein
MHQAIIHRAEQLFTSPSKASMMGHFGGVLGGCTRGWAGFPTSSHPRFCYSIVKGSEFWV